MFTDDLFYVLYLFTNISVASASINRVSHEKTHNIQTIAQNVKFKPPSVTVNILSAQYGHKMFNYVIVKNIKLGVFTLLVSSI